MPDKNVAIGLCMYTKFFGLSEKPFSITPDPHFLFLSERHAEALAHLVYGVTESGGFIQLTGEVGTGKTTLTRSLLERLPEAVDLAAILNPRLTVPEFLHAIFDELGIDNPDSNSTRELVEALNHHLLDAHERGRKTVLLVDEAQNLDTDVLEQLRLLTNLETAKQKLLQIILVGQPELRTLLGRNDLRQLAQRITGRYHLEALNDKETIAYVRHRMTVAGASTDVFTPSALWEINRIAQGIPRVINVICDRALLGAFSEESHKVTRSIVKRAANEVHGNRQPATTRTRNWPTAGRAIAAIALLGFGLWGLSTALRSSPEPTPDVQATTAEPSSPTPFVARALSVSDRLAPLTSTEALADGPAASATLGELLSDPTINTGTDAAFAELFAAWSVTLRTGPAPCAQAQTQDLKCAFQVGSLRLLRTMNRPAILSLVDSDGSAHNAVVVALNGNTMTLRFGTAEHRVALDDVAQFWLGEFLLLWRPLHGPAELLLPGTRDSGNAWLRRTLAQIQSLPLTSDDPNYFDSSLRRQLQAFQRSRRLEADGKAGVQTLIAINSARALPGTPYLEAP
ncbi:MAG: AAA family ATPase [Gammaproteobacteria bacterium]